MCTTRHNRPSSRHRRTRNKSDTGIALPKSYSKSYSQAAAGAPPSYSHAILRPFHACVLQRRAQVRGVVSGGLVRVVWSAWRSSLWGRRGFQAGRGRRAESVRGTGRRGRGTCGRVHFVERWSCSALLPCKPRGPRTRARRAMMQKGENPRHGRCAGRRGRAAVRTRRARTVALIALHPRRG